jgi:glycosyltransferase involved in cell wall biosynthesis
MPACSTSPSVSVIVVSLNAASTIDATLDSIIAAFKVDNHHKLELILVDGGSQDETIGRVEARRHQIACLKIIHQTSRGIGAARNQGIAAATSSLIGFCDADDAWTHDAITLKCEALYQTPSAWGVTGKVSFRTVDGDKSAAHARRCPGSEHLGYTPGALLMHHKIFSMVGPFDNSLRIGADSDWIMRAVQLLGPPLMIPQTVLEKGLRPGSLSTDVVTYRREMIMIARRFIERARHKVDP